MTASEAVTGDRDWGRIRDSGSGRISFRIRDRVSSRGCDRGRIRIDPDPDPDPVPDAMILKRLDSERPTATPATSTRITFCIVLFSDDFS